MNILNYLDEKIELFRQKNKDYPKIILMSLDSKNKIFESLESELKILKNKKDNSWYDTKDNYRGIPIKVKENIFIELKGEIKWKQHYF